jgi:hypothetical protein
MFRGLEIHARISRKIVFFSAFAALLTVPHDPARAITLTSKGGGVLLSGGIKPGDHIEFREFIASANPRFIELDSKGGDVNAAGEIGRLIRKKNLPTVVDASRSTCGSACTIIFASGASRHYVGAEKVQDGVGDMKRPGLGYHEGNNFLASGQRGQSGATTGRVIDLYYEFGSGKASSIVTKADWKHFYYISTATALELGLATSAKRP